MIADNSCRKSMDGREESMAMGVHRRLDESIQEGMIISVLHQSRLCLPSAGRTKLSSPTAPDCCVESVAIQSLPTQSLWALGISRPWGPHDKA